MFTSEEIEIIENGLDALVSKAGNDVFTKGLLGLLLSNDKNQAEEKANEISIELQAQEDTQRILKRQITMIKAKLYQLENKEIADEMSNILRGE